MKNYTGKIVYVGVDVHKKTYSVTCVCDGEVVKRDRLKADIKSLIKYLKDKFKGGQIKTAYEAGFSGFGLHRELEKAGIKNTLVHAASVEISARDRVKTDKRDSLKLAVQLSQGRLQCIHIPTEERVMYREISRLRSKIKSEQQSKGNQLKSLLMRHELLKADDEEKVSLKWLKKIESFDCHEEVKYVIKMFAEQWRRLEKDIKEIEVKLEEQAKEDKAIDEVYRSAPGIGKIHARILANELGDMSQFSNEKQLFSFTGLTPTEDSSGEHRRLGHISRQGRAILRWSLTQVAWVAIRRDISLRKRFEEIAARQGKKKAIIAIARRLIGRIRSCFMNQELYRMNEKICPKTGEVLAGA